MRELLRLCGYEDPEIEAELPRVTRAFEKVTITSADIERGKQRLSKYYDIDLKGVRKAFRLCLREFVKLNTGRRRPQKKADLRIYDSWYGRVRFGPVLPVRRRLFDPSLLGFSMSSTAVFLIKSFRSLRMPRKNG